MIALVTRHTAQAATQLHLHLETTLNVTAQQARRLVNRSVVTELGTGLIAHEPELLVKEQQILWRVPIILSLPTLGNLGQVGVVEIDAQTGELLTDLAVQEAIRQHAERR